MARAGARLPGDEAWFVGEEASGWDRAELVRRFDEPAPERLAAYAESMVDRRVAGEPLQYVLGRWGFRGLDLMVDRRVLIPRPETETVVDVALDELRRTFAAAGDRAAGPPFVVDLGTGSGAIALAVATEVADALVWATDVSDDALAVARANLAGSGSAVGPRVRLATGRWFEALPDALRGRVDLIVSNPPYVAEGEALPPEVAEWEPRPALVAGSTGLEAIGEVVGGARGWLARPGALVVEVAPHQAEAAAAMARETGLVDVEVRDDLAGRPRVLVARTVG
ncbi:MAG: release factor glutamine methyltransferase [Actinomycetota bacterium]|nr:release factor glutamine methyltransferase [Actinomycetota bacterium]